eukprot:768614-Amorphochlora_amoeboformis.AAC.2
MYVQLSGQLEEIQASGEHKLSFVNAKLARRFNVFLIFPPGYRYGGHDPRELEHEKVETRGIRFWGPQTVKIDICKRMDQEKIGIETDKPAEDKFKEITKRFRQSR